MIRKSTYTLLFILLALVAVVIFLQRTPGMNTDSDNQPTSTTSPLVIEIGDKTVTAVGMSDDQGHVFNASLDNTGSWFIEQPSGCKLENDKVAYTLSLLKTYTVMVSLETPPALADVGLTKPTYMMELIFDDGTTLSMSVGSIVPTGTGYYVQVNKDPVIVVSTYSVESLFELVSSACATPTPEVTATNTPDLTLTQALISTMAPTP